jgi:hypothetical protein
MKRTVLLFTAISLCFVSFTFAYAQKQRKFARPRQSVKSSEKRQESSPKSTEVQDKSKSQTYEGIKISVASVERSSSIALNSCPSSPGYVQVSARSGYEFVIVRVNIKVLTEYKGDSLERFDKRIEITDAEGKRHGSSVVWEKLGKAREFPCKFVFGVPSGIKTKNFHFGETSFDLEKLDANKPD